MSKATVLLVDNDKDYRESLRQLLELEDYAVVEAVSIEEASERLRAESVDLVLADLRLADHENDRDFSGLKVAKLATGKGISCIVITSYDTVEATRRALRARGGQALAEDFVPKQDGPQAVLDAIEVVLNRKSEPLEEEAPDLEIDLLQGLVRLEGTPLRLSRNQYTLLAYLYRKEGAVCSPEELIEAVYNEDLTHKQASTDKRLQRLVDRLRKKLKENAREPRHLIRVHGRGFRLEL